METMVPYDTMGMAPAVPQQLAAVKREADFTRVHYNQNGIPITHSHHRHSSMPAYGLEYSPAPSFVSSGYEDYSNRGLSFEPITPPQQALGMTAEPAYIANEETGLYSVIPDHMSGMSGLGGMVQMPSHLTGPQFPRSYGANNIYSVIEGSPTYKQRRRRTSIPTSMSGIAPTSTPSAPHRPSDLRRSVSVSMGPVAEGEESNGNSPSNMSYANSQHKDLMDMSRHGSPAVHPMALQHDFSHISDDMSADGRSMMAGGIVRRARSATVMELGPYPHKSHSCPIPTCGRLFKRLEHLKR